MEYYIYYIEEDKGSGIRVWTQLGPNLGSLPDALVAEKEERKAAEAARRAAGGDASAAPVGQVFWNNGYSSGTLAASIKLSSNAVMRG